ncbi:MAG: autotransporter outer membrane beta-barrel domain-containing protein [Puniceicoccales bacterium]|jgi:hypothetical protein|nr:autotransporter outer membrane beta-barrel domain-containing protein [Puniceicoccales bacterium]
MVGPSAAAGKSFDGKVPYLGGRAGLGYRWENLRNFSAELYGKYLYSILKGKKFEEEEISLRCLLSHGPANSLRPVNSHRARLGCRLAYPFHWKLTPWCGAFYEREFFNAARGTADGAEISQPSSKSGSMAGELGLSYWPIPAAAVELALSGSAGTQTSYPTPRGAKGAAGETEKFPMGSLSAEFCNLRNFPHFGVNLTANWHCLTKIYFENRQSCFGLYVIHLSLAF